MRLKYDKNGSLCMYADNDYEFGIMDMIHEEIYGHKLTFSYFSNYEYYRENGIILAYSNETDLRSLIEKMKYNRIERLLQIRNEDKLIRLVARVMLELWR